MNASVVRDAYGRADGCTLRIDIVVHGRFHAFHLARALIERGHDVRLLTNYPGWAVERFGIPRDRIRSFVSHGLAVRLNGRLAALTRVDLGRPALHIAFGQWAARHVRGDCDLVYVFSGVGEETLRRFEGRQRPIVWLVRGSAHIAEQYDLLAAEEARAGARLDKPTPWLIARERREYELAAQIVTLSSFSYETFRQRPELASKALLLLSAVDVDRFRPGRKRIEERLARIQRGDALRILTVGSFSFRKGALDLVEVAGTLKERMKFRFVGDLPGETRSISKQAAHSIEFLPRVPEFELVDHYAWADVFLFPTIEDGFPAVVAQAQASGLPVVTTPNGSGPDLVTHGHDGWILPIRRPQDIIETLQSCDRDRARLWRMVQASRSSPRTRDWSAMATDLECHLRDRTRIAAREGPVVPR